MGILQVLRLEFRKFRILEILNFQPCNFKCQKNRVSRKYCKFRNFHEGFIFAKFRENRTSRYDEITLSFTNIGKPTPSREFSLSFKAIRENKILTKFSEFTEALSWLIRFKWKMMSNSYSRGGCLGF